MRIAWFTPFSRLSAIGKYSDIVLAELSREHQIEIFASDLSPNCQGWPTSLPIRRILGKGGRPNLVQLLAEFDAVIYNLGNNLPLHIDIYRTSQVYPGIIILHDLSLSQFFEQLYLSGELDSGGWVNQMAFAHGQAGAVLANQIVKGDRLPIGHGPAALTYHMARTAIHGCLGVVVHGQWAREQLASVASMPVAQIDFPAPRLPATPTETPTLLVDRKLQLLTFGIVNPNKIADQVIQAIAASPVLRNRVIYSIAGAWVNKEYLEELQQLIRSNGLQETVLLLGEQTEAALVHLINEADLLINLRNPHFGECSWSLVEGLFMGKPIVVWKHGYYDEFPPTVVKKVASLGQLRSTLEELCADPEQRQRMGREARSYAQQRFSTQSFSRQLIAFCQQCVTNRPLYKLVDDVSYHIREIIGDSSLEHLEKLVSDEVSTFAGG